MFVMVKPRLDARSGPSFRSRSPVVGAVLVDALASGPPASFAIAAPVLTRQKADVTQASMTPRRTAAPPLRFRCCELFSTVMTDPLRSCAVSAVCAGPFG